MLVQAFSLYCVLSRVVLSTIISPYLSYYVYQRSSGVETKGYEPFCCLAFGSAAEHQLPLAGGEQEFISIPPLPFIFKNTLTPFFGLIGLPTSFIL